MAQWFLPYHLQIHEMLIYPHKTADNKLSVLANQIFTKTDKTFSFLSFLSRHLACRRKYFSESFLCCFTTKIAKDASSGKRHRDLP